MLPLVQGGPVPCGGVGADTVSLGLGDLVLGAQHSLMQGSEQGGYTQGRASMHSMHGTARQTSILPLQERMWIAQRVVMLAALNKCRKGSIEPTVADTMHQAACEHNTLFCCVNRL